MQNEKRQQQRCSVDFVSTVLFECVRPIDAARSGVVIPTFVISPLPKGGAPRPLIAWLSCVGICMQRNLIF